MTRRTALSFLIIASVVAQAAIADAEEKADRKTAFAQFKQLAGEWVGKKQGKDGHDLHVQYKVTAGGSAVVETLMPGTAHEMVTVIYPEGDSLLLTHYCMLGNQPHMKASARADGDKVAFKFVSATNLKSEKDRHMHDVTFTFADRDTLRTEWIHFMDGKAGEPVTFEVRRKK